MGKETEFFRAEFSLIGHFRRFPPHILPKVPGKQRQEFMKRAETPPAFGRARLQLHRRRPHFNDDVELEAYQPTNLILAGKQRRGIREHLDSRRAYPMRVKGAIPFIR